jgi:hypothetical protein
MSKAALDILTVGLAAGGDSVGRHCRLPVHHRHRWVAAQPDLDTTRRVAASVSVVDLRHLQESTP